MSGNRLRSPVGLLALVACLCSASAAHVDNAQAPARQPSVTTDVVYGHKDGLALTLDVHRPARPNGAGLISIVSGRACPRHSFESTARNTGSRAPLPPISNAPMPH